MSRRRNTPPSLSLLAMYASGSQAGECSAKSSTPGHGSLYTYTPASRSLASFSRAIPPSPAPSQQSPHLNPRLYPLFANLISSPQFTETLASQPSSHRVVSSSLPQSDGLLTLIQASPFYGTYRHSSMPKARPYTSQLAPKEDKAETLSVLSSTTGGEMGSVRKESLSRKVRPWGGFISSPQGRVRGSSTGTAKSHLFGDDIFKGPTQAPVNQPSLYREYLICTWRAILMRQRAGPMSLSSLSVLRASSPATVPMSQKAATSGFAIHRTESIAGLSIANQSTRTTPRPSPFAHVVRTFTRVFNRPKMDKETTAPSRSQSRLSRFSRRTARTSVAPSVSSDKSSVLSFVTASEKGQTPNETPPPRSPRTLTRSKPERYSRTYRDVKGSLPPRPRSRGLPDLPPPEVKRPRSPSIPFSVAHYSTSQHSLPLPSTSPTPKLDSGSNEVGYGSYGSRWDWEATNARRKDDYHETKSTKSGRGGAGTVWKKWTKWVNKEREDKYAF